MAESRQVRCGSPIADVAAVRKDACSSETATSHQRIYIHSNGNRSSRFLLAAGQYVMPTSVPARTWVFLVLSGLATGASWLCCFRALKFGPATLVAPIDKLSVVLVALFAFVFLGERPSPIGWLGICLITAGSVLIAIRA